MDEYDELEGDGELWWLGVLLLAGSTLIVAGTLYLILF